MTTTTTTLTDFLLARIAEDEALAQAASDLRWDAGEACVWGSPDLITVVSDGPDGRGGTDTTETAEHIARHDPARVLAECEAKRRIVEECGPDAKHYNLDVLALLALPYADHPDYDPSWRP